MPEVPPDALRGLRALDRSSQTCRASGSIDGDLGSCERVDLDAASFEC